MRIAGHHDGPSVQPGTVQLKSSSPPAPRVRSPEKKGSGAGGASGGSGAGGAPAVTKVEHGPSLNGLDGVAARTEAEERDAIIRYWQWKASEGHTQPTSQAPFIQAAIEQTMERLSRPNSAGSALSARTLDPFR